MLDLDEYLLQSILILRTSFFWIHFKEGDEKDEKDEKRKKERQRGVKLDTQMLRSDELKRGDQFGQFDVSITWNLSQSNCEKYINIVPSHLLSPLALTPLPPIHCPFITLPLLPPSSLPFPLSSYLWTDR